MLRYTMLCFLRCYVWLRYAMLTLCYGLRYASGARGTTRLDLRAVDMRTPRAILPMAKAPRTTQAAAATTPPRRTSDVISTGQAVRCGPACGGCGGSGSRGGRAV